MRSGKGRGCDDLHRGSVKGAGVSVNHHCVGVSPDENNY